MCGRYAAAKAIDAVAGHFGADGIDYQLTPPGYNVAPTDRVPVVVQWDGSRSVVGMRWGLVPSWAPDPSVGSRMINARVETLADKPAFRTPLAQRRAIMPADAYYEWYTRPGTAKQPHAIRRADGEMLAFAALWERWRTAAGEELLSCTVVTTASAGSVAYLHDRMPVVLPRDLWDDWLDPQACDRADAVALLHAAGVPELVAHPVSTRVNNVRSEGADLLDEAAPAPTADQLDLFG
ncbi:MAG: SOS response-associated peptidase [Mycobacteriales bacterium]